MSNKIKHSGVVEAIDGGHVKVRILQTSACAGCKIAGHCNSAESKEKTIDVYDVPGAPHLNVGDEVVVTASARVAVSALMIGFGMPFVVLVGVIFIVYLMTGDEPLAAMCGLGALIPYYIGVWLCRERLSGRISFEIEG